MVKKRPTEVLELREPRPSSLTLELRAGLQSITTEFAGQFRQLTREMTDALQEQSRGITQLNEKSDRTDQLLQHTLTRVAALEEGRVMARLAERPGPTVSKALEYEGERGAGMGRTTPHVSRIPPAPSVTVTSPTFESPLKQSKMPSAAMGEGSVGLATKIPATAEAMIKAMCVDDDGEMEAGLREKLASMPRQASITAAALKALLDGKLSVMITFSGQTVPGASSMVAVPLGESFKALVEAIYGDKYRFCFLQEHDLALFLICLEEHGGLRRAALRALTHGTPMRVCLHWLFTQCPHHGDNYDSSRWAGLKVFSDAVRVIRAQGYKGDIGTVQVLSVIQEFGAARSNRDRLDMTIALLPDSVMRALTGHLPPQERTSVSFETLMESAPSVLQALEKQLPPASEKPKGGAREQSPAHERRPIDGWLGIGALAVPPCDTCRVFGFPAGEEMYPDRRTGECPFQMLSLIPI